MDFKDLFVIWEGCGNSNNVYWFGFDFWNSGCGLGDLAWVLLILVISTFLRGFFRFWVVLGARRHPRCFPDPVRSILAMSPNRTVWNRFETVFMIFLKNIPISSLQNL